MSKRKTHEQFISELNNSNVEVLETYTGLHTKILVRYKDCGHEELKQPIKLLRGQGCGKCKNKSISKAKIRSAEQYKKDLKARGIDYIEVTGNYTGIKNPVTVVNKLCGHEYSANAGNILQGSGCPICYGLNRTTADFSKILDTKYPGEYEVLGEYVNNRTKVLVKHKCGYEWKVIPKDIFRDIRCPHCNISKGEYHIENFLKEHGIPYENQKWFPDCKDKNPLPFDFAIYVNGEMRLIEFDGSHHYKNTMYHRDKVNLHDEMKNEYCRKNNIKLLRIPYWWLRNDKIDKALSEFVL